MVRSYPRLTVENVAEVEGPGLHSGVACRVRIHAGRQGFRFLTDSGWIDAIPENVTDTSRCTRLGDVSTVEHVLSALAGMGITDADIEVSGGELPVADGCAEPFVQAILGARFQDVGQIEVEGPFARVFSQELPSKYAVGTGEGWWRAAYVREEEFVGRQEYEFQWSAERYSQEVAPARTFVLESELALAQSAGLGRGLDEASCLVVGSAGYGNVARFDDEPSRHKLLDLIGDLALAGVPVAHLDVVAEFTGHTLNVAVAKKLRDSVKVSRS
ncbi:hypothetical protein C0431_03110 [bacterium]|nr:hypothetical protein [bacterium]